MYDFHFRIGQKIMIIFVGLCAGSSEFFAGFVGSFLDDIAECYDLAEITVILHCRKMLLIGDTAAADNADL